VIGLVVPLAVKSVATPFTKAVTVKVVPAAVAGAGTNETTAEVDPAPLDTAAVTCDGVDGAEGVTGIGAGASPPPPPLLADVVSDAVAGIDAPPELFATIWNL
jgi:hypothetical protein